MPLKGFGTFVQGCDDEYAIPPDGDAAASGIAARHVDVVACLRETRRDLVSVRWVPFARDEVGHALDDCEPWSPSQYELDASHRHVRSGISTCLAPRQRIRLAGRREQADVDVPVTVQQLASVYFLG